ncbi:MAG TPA: chromosomal replication initiator protein DnaA [Candidatus Methylomirabilis sp.]|jgi:chromosomal replication initiator protein|nr:chromosomal replication initiator protein DnaA [Candidatus Methylomirabilis sp.]
MVTGAHLTQEIWQEALSAIRERINGHSYETWFKPLTLSLIEANRARVSLPNSFFKEWFEEHYLDLLKGALEDLVFTKVNLELVISDGEAGPALAPTPSRDGSGRRSARRPPASPASLNPRYTFDSFVVGSGNQFAHAASSAVADQLSKAYNPLFIYGGVGLGKTHLLQAIGHLALQRQHSLRISYVSSEKFTNDLINAIRFDATREFRTHYRGLDLLLVDDIQFIAGKERTQEEFFHTFNDLYNAPKQIVISSDSMPKEIPGLEERLRSRFEWGLIADIQPPDLETKAAILRKKAQAEGLRIPDEVSLFIAKSVKSNVRELEGYLVRLVAFASLTGQEISLQLAQEVLKELVRDDRSISIGHIQRLVADYYHLKVKELISRNRNKAVVLPRQVAMYLSRAHTGASLPDIGAAFGGKDHSTVIHACTKVRDLLAREEGFRKQVTELTTLLTG